MKQTIILAALLFFCVGSSGAANKADESSPKEIFNNSAWTGDFDQMKYWSPEKTAHQIKKPEDLSGQQIWVRKSSSYFQSLLRLNKKFSQTKLKPVEIKDVNEILEDEDILEMMNVGIIPMSVIDNYNGIYKIINTSATIWLKRRDNVLKKPLAFLRSTAENTVLITLSRPGLSGVPY